ncbi:MAG: sarcosine oxidase subunit alpha [Actinomycetota bacterium]|nr:MAG: sarcosine oxidase subunit alpha [Actinomycetota bacterium]
MTGPRRLPTGGAWIDRARPLTLRFEGRDVPAFEGDTVASALLGAGVTAAFRSPILGRPRGVVAAGPEEPNAYVEVTRPAFEAIVAATTLPVGDGMEVAPRPGVGRLPTGEVPSRRAVHTHRHVETLVIGAGPAGRAAASAAVAAGRVLLVDERHRIDDPPEGVACLARTTATGVYDDGYVVCYERGAELDRVWHVRARRVVLASGAHERTVAFAGNDRPGVMLAGAVRTYLERYGVLCGERAVVLSTNAWGHESALALAAAGASVLLLEPVPIPGEVPDLTSAGVEVRAGWVVTGTEGQPTLAAVHLAGPGGERETVAADLLAVSGGWSPTLQLARAIGCGLRYDEARACSVPDGTGPDWLEIVGAAAGEVPPSAPLFRIEQGDDADKFVEPQRDQTVADVAVAIGRGLRSVEHVKRATYIGTTIDQGRTSGVLTAEIVNELLGLPHGSQPPTSPRPPYTPIPYSALAGLDRGPRLLDPVRTTPMHPAHLARGAVFEDVGQWKRPRYFPRQGEDMEAAVTRECLAVRTAAGVLDASTLGKIEVVGPDAAVFLDRMYVNRMSTLPVGRARYGVMLGLDGMVVDDGVAARLAEDRFLVTTTTSGAAMVLDRFEEWLQTEWPDLRVWCTSVTERWAVAAISGPSSREVVAALEPSVDLDPEVFPHMAVREGEVAGVPARILRVSFTGERSYELHVPARYGLGLWEELLRVGAALGLEPYGTEAMHVLRAEKGYVIVGQDTDGTVTAEDLGLGWLVRGDGSDFVGRRSLARPELRRPDRRQLVGLLPEDPETLVPEGAQLVEGPVEPPTHALGWVTSSYRSPTLGRTFALALVEAGRSRIGTTLVAPLASGPVRVRVTEPVFYDPEGSRLR